MNILLLSMPDSFEHMPPIAIRMPNGALASLAANVDMHHHVAIADLILARAAVRATVEKLVADQTPDVVGLSVMTFQRKTALQIARLVRLIRPSARIVVGGYDPSLAPDAYEPSPDIDFIVRGEGEHTFRELLRALECHDPRAEDTSRGESRRNESRIPSPESRQLSSISGLTYRDGARVVRNTSRPVIPLATERLRLPNRRARVLGGYTLLGRPIDVVETSRGCTFDCSFCSIIEMRGRNFHPYAIDRVIADISDARAHGARSIFLVDDNITLDVHRFVALCEAIIDAGFNDTEYFVQAMTAPLAQHGATLAPLMRRAGFRYVFLGIENILEDDLAFLKARAKNARREHGRTVGNASIAAIEHLHRHGMYVVGGLIVGNPDDTRESIEANLTFARQYV
ncbi:MAG TPA: radical SAM protein, partial [Vicinamibacterales bacterium]